MEENKTNEVPQSTQVTTAVQQLFKEEVSKTKNVDEAVEIMVTHESLAEGETLEKLVKEKGKEQESRYEAKRLEAEALKFEKEAEKIKQEKEKELAELDKEIARKKAEVEQLKADADKAKAFFDSNEEILSCIGITSAKSLKVMYCFMPLAVFIFLIIRFVALPLTVGGKLVEIVIQIIAGICKTITNSALKIIISVLVILLLAGGGFCAYYFGGQLIL